MIEYHGDNLVPPELCALLYHVVPKSAHVPVRFFNRHDAHGEPTRGKRSGYPTPYGIFRHGKRPWIGINLNALYFKTAEYPHPRLAISTAVWRALLEVCLQEFGHSATREIADRMNKHEYRDRWGRVYRHTEQLAEDWKGVRLERIPRHDPRLGQPRIIAGYLGVRLAERRIRLAKLINEPGDVRVAGTVRAAYFKEQRCWKAGAQLTSGDVLRELGLEPRLFSNAYRVLRRASEGVGVDHLDGAGRRHKLYVWGDVPLLRELMQDRLDELVFRPEPTGPRKYWVSEDGRTIVSPDGSEPVWSEVGVQRGDPDAPF